MKQKIFIIYYHHPLKNEILSSARAVFYLPLN